MVRRLAREEGLLAGISSRRGARRDARRAPSGSSAASIVTVFPDGAEKYLDREVLDEPMSEPPC